MVFVIGTGPVMAQQSELPQKREENPRARTAPLPSKEVERPAAREQRPAERPQERAAQPEPKAGAKEPQRGEAVSPLERKQAQEPLPPQPVESKRQLGREEQPKQDNRAAEERKQLENRSSSPSRSVSSCLMLQPVPEELVRTHPELGRYRYLAIGDQVVLVDPDKQKIVQLID